MNSTSRTLLSTICFIGLGGMPHERAVFSPMEGGGASGGGAAAPSGGAPAGGASGSAPAGGAAPGSAESTPATGGAAPTGGAKPPTPAKPTREPIKVKHKHKHTLAEEGAEPRELDLELELDIAEHLGTHKRKMKVDGRDVDVSTDEAFDRYPLAQGAHTRLQEAHALKTKAEKQIGQAKQLVESLRTEESAVQVLRRTLGAEKLQKLAMGLVVQQIEYDRMTPVQREAHDRQRQFEEASRQREQDLGQREARLTKGEQAAREREVTGHFERMQREFPTHLETAGVPVTDASFREMVGIIADARRLGYKMTPQEAAREMRTRLDTLLGEVVKKGDPERVRALLGDDGAEAIRQLEVKRLEEQPGRVIAAPTPPPRAPNASTTQGPQSLEELRREMRRDAIAEEQKRLRR